MNRTIAGMTVGALLNAGAASAAAIHAVPGGSAWYDILAIFIGFILAVAFQMVLTSLSAAAGITAVGDLAESPEENEGRTPSGQAITGAFGAWMLVTACISLFFASWLAVKFSAAPGKEAGGVLGLAIWGVFYLTVASFEAVAASSIVGAVYTAASSGLRAIKDAAAAVLSPSPASQASEMAAAMREEIFGGADANDLLYQIRSLVRDLRPATIDASSIAEELARLLNETEIDAVTTHDGTLNRDKLVATLNAKYGTWERLKGAAETGKAAAGSVAERADKIRRDWEEYLRSTGKEALNPDAIKREVELIFEDPKAGLEALRTRASEVFNKSTMTEILAKRADLGPEEAKQAADRIERVVLEIRGRAQHMASAAEAVRGGALNRVRDYLNSLNRPELRFEGLREDFDRIFTDPRAGAEALLKRFKSLDRESIKAVIASRKDMSPEDAEYVLSQIESARDAIVDKALRAKDEAAARVVELKRAALERAERARRVAVSAAWWMALGAVCSGLAAWLGAIAAV